MLIVLDRPMTALKFGPKMDKRIEFKQAVREDDINERPSSDLTRELENEYYYRN